MVHILFGYPKQSPGDPEIALLAFYLRLSSGTVVNKDVVKNIVESDMSNIGGSMGSTIVRVEPFPSTTEKIEGNNEDKESEAVIIPTSVTVCVSVGGALFFVTIVALLLRFKKRKRY